MLLLAERRALDGVWGTQDRTGILAHRRAQLYNYVNTNRLKSILRATGSQ